MCKNRDFALYGLWRPYKATKSHFFGIINVWGSSLGSRRNLHIGFIMGCRGGFSRKMQKTGGGGRKSPPLNETRVKKDTTFFLEDSHHEYVHSKKNYQNATNVTYYPIFFTYFPSFITCLKILRHLMISPLLH